MIPRLLSTERVAQFDVRHIHAKSATKSIQKGKYFENRRNVKSEQKAHFAAEYAKQTSLVKSCPKSNLCVAAQYLGTYVALFQRYMAMPI